MDPFSISLVGRAVLGSVKYIGKEVMTNVAIGYFREAASGVFKNFLSSGSDQINLYGINSFNRKDVLDNQTTFAGAYAKCSNAGNKGEFSTEFFTTITDSKIHINTLYRHAINFEKALDEQIKKIKDRSNTPNELDIARDIVVAYNTMITNIGCEIFGRDKMNSTPTTRLDEAQLEKICSILKDANSTAIQKIDAMDNLLKLTETTEQTPDTNILTQSASPKVPLIGNILLNTLDPKHGEKIYEERRNYIKEMLMVEASIAMLQTDNNRDKLLNYYMYGVVKLPKLDSTDTNEKKETDLKLAAAETVAFFDSIPSKNLTNLLLASVVRNNPNRDVGTKKICGVGMPAIYNIYLANTQLDVLSKIVFRDKNKGYSTYLVSELNSNEFQGQKDLSDGIYVTTDKIYYQVIGSKIEELTLKNLSQDMQIYKGGNQLQDDTCTTLFEGYTQNNEDVTKYLDGYMRRILAQNFTEKNDYKTLYPRIKPDNIEEEIKYIRNEHINKNDQKSKGIIFTLNHITEFKKALKGINANSEFKSKLTSKLKREAQKVGVDLKTVTKRGFDHVLGGYEGSTTENLNTKKLKDLELKDLVIPLSKFQGLEDIAALLTVANGAKNFAECTSFCNHIVSQQTKLISQLQKAIEDLGSHYKDTQTLFITTGFITNLFDSFYNFMLANNNIHRKKLSELNITIPEDTTEVKKEDFRKNIEKYDKFNLENFNNLPENVTIGTILGSMNRPDDKVLVDTFLNSNEFNLLFSGLAKLPDEAKEVKNVIRQLLCSNTIKLFRLFNDNQSLSEKKFPIQQNINSEANNYIYKNGNKLCLSINGTLIEATPQEKVRKKSSTEINLKDLKDLDFTRKDSQTNSTIKLSKIEKVIMLSQLTAASELDILVNSKTALDKVKNNISKQNNALNAKQKQISDIAIELQKAINGHNIKEPVPIDLNLMIEQIMQQIENGEYQNQPSLVLSTIMQDQDLQQQEYSEKCRSMAAKFASCCLNYIGIKNNSISIANLQNNQYTILRKLVVAIHDYIKIEESLKDTIKNTIKSLNDEAAKYTSSNKSYNTLCDNTKIILLPFSDTFSTILDMANSVKQILDKSNAKNKNSTARDYFQSLFKFNTQSNSALVNALAPTSNMLQAMQIFTEAYKNAEESTRDNVAKIIHTINSVAGAKLSATAKADEKDLADTKGLLSKLCDEYEKITSGKIDDASITQAKQQLQKLNHIKLPIYKEIDISTMLANNLEPNTTINVYGVNLYNINNTTSMASATKKTKFLDIGRNNLTENKESLDISAVNDGIYPIKIKDKIYYVQIKEYVQIKDYVQIKGKVGKLINLKSEKILPEDVDKLLDYTYKMCHEYFEGLNYPLSQEELTKLVGQIAPSLKNMGLLFGVMEAKFAVAYFDSIKVQIRTVADKLFNNVVTKLSKIEEANQERYIEYLKKVGASLKIQINKENSRIKSELELLKSQLSSLNQLKDNPPVRLNVEGLQTQCDLLSAQITLLENGVKKNELELMDCIKMETGASIQNIVGDGIARGCIELVTALLNKSPKELEQLSNNPKKLESIITDLFKQNYSDLDSFVDQVKSIFSLSLYSLRNQIKYGVKRELKNTISTTNKLKKQKVEDNHQLCEAAQPQYSEIDGYQLVEIDHEGIKFQVYQKDDNYYQIWDGYNHQLEITSEQSGSENKLYISNIMSHQSLQLIATANKLKNQIKEEIANNELNTNLNAINATLGQTNLSIEALMDKIKFITSDNGGPLEINPTKGITIYYKSIPKTSEDTINTIPANAKLTFKLKSKYVYEQNDKTSYSLSEINKMVDKFNLDELKDLEQKLKNRSNEIKKILNELNKYFSVTTNNNNNNIKLGINDNTDRIAASEYLKNNISEIMTRLKDISELVQAELTQSEHSISERYSRSKLSDIEKQKLGSVDYLYSATDITVPIINKNDPTPKFPQDKISDTYITQDNFGKYTQIFRVKGVSDTIDEFSVTLTSKNDQSIPPQASSNYRMSQNDCIDSFNGFFPPSIINIFKITGYINFIKNDENGRPIEHFNLDFINSDNVARLLLAKQFMRNINDSTIMFPEIKEVRLTLKNPDLLVTYQKWLPIYNALASKLNSVATDQENTQTNSCYQQQKEAALLHFKTTPHIILINSIYDKIILDLDNQNNKVAGKLLSDYLTIVKNLDDGYFYLHNTTPKTENITDPQSMSNNVANQHNVDNSRTWRNSISRGSQPPLSALPYDNNKPQKNLTAVPIAITQNNTVEQIIQESAPRITSSLNTEMTKAQKEFNMFQNITSLLDNQMKRIIRNLLNINVTKQHINSYIENNGAGIIKIDEILTTINNQPRGNSSYKLTKEFSAKISAHCARYNDLIELKNIINACDRHLSLNSTKDKNLSKQLLDSNAKGPIKLSGNDIKTIFGNTCSKSIVTIKNKTSEDILLVSKSANNTIITYKAVPSQLNKINQLVTNAQNSQLNVAITENQLCQLFEGYIYTNNHRYDVIAKFLKTEPTYELGIFFAGNDCFTKNEGFTQQIITEYQNYINKALGTYSLIFFALYSSNLSYTDFNELFNNNVGVEFLNNIQTIAGTNNSCEYLFNNRNTRDILILVLVAIFGAIIPNDEISSMVPQDYKTFETPIKSFAMLLGWITGKVPPNTSNSLGSSYAYNVATGYAHTLRGIFKEQQNIQSISLNPQRMCIFMAQINLYTLFIPAVIHKEDKPQLLDNSIKNSELCYTIDTLLESNSKTTISDSTTGFHSTTLSKATDLIRILCADFTIPNVAMDGISEKNNDSNNINSGAEDHNPVSRNTIHETETIFENYSNENINSHVTLSTTAPSNLMNNRTNISSGGNATSWNKAGLRQQPTSRHQINMQNTNINANHTHVRKTIAINDSNPSLQNTSDTLFSMDD